MNETYFRINSILKKMDENSKLKGTMKGVAALVVFVIWFCSSFEPESNKLAWVVSIFAIFITFGIDVYFTKQNKDCEFKIYLLESEELRNKKEIAEITGEILPDVVLNKKLTPPSNEINLPIVFYAIMLVLDILIGIIMIF